MLRIHVTFSEKYSQRKEEHFLWSVSSKEKTNSFEQENINVLFVALSLSLLAEAS